MIYNFKILFKNAKFAKLCNFKKIAAKVNKIPYISICKKA